MQIREYQGMAVACLYDVGILAPYGTDDSRIRIGVYLVL